MFFIWHDTARRLFNLAQWRRHYDRICQLFTLKITKTVVKHDRICKRKISNNFIDEIFYHILILTFMVWLARDKSNLFLIRRRNFLLFHDQKLFTSFQIFSFHIESNVKRMNNKVPFKKNIRIVDSEGKSNFWAHADWQFLIRCRSIEWRLLGRVQFFRNFSSPTNKFMAFWISIFICQITTVMSWQLICIDTFENFRQPLFSITVVNLNLWYRVLVQKLSNNVEGKRENFWCCEWEIWDFKIKFYEIWDSLPFMT